MSTDVCIGAESENFTYNYQPVFEHIGLRSITMLDGMTGRFALRIVELLIIGVNKMTDEQFNALVRAGGEWGNKETCLRSLYRLMRLCEAMPNERIETH